MGSGWLRNLFATPPIRLRACNCAVVGKVDLSFGRVLDLPLLPRLHLVPSRNVLDRPEDPGALDVEDGVPPPRAAPPLLRRVVLSQSP